MLIFLGFLIFLFLRLIPCFHIRLPWCPSPSFSKVSLHHCASLPACEPASFAGCGPPCSASTWIGCSLFIPGRHMEPSSPFSWITCYTVFFLSYWIQLSCTPVNPDPEMRGCGSLFQKSSTNFFFRSLKVDKKAFFFWVKMGFLSWF